MNDFGSETPKPTENIINGKKEGQFSAKGYHGHVREVSEDERQRFPGADLVKETKESNDPFEAERMSLEHRIANILFPGSFVEVVGTDTIEVPQPDPWDNKKIWPSKYTHKIYSRKLPIPPEHAGYSTDMTQNWPGKVSTCDCEACANHRKYHEDEHLEERFEESFGEMGKAGIRPAGEMDPSDYCLTNDGRLVFFELDEFEPEVAEKFLRAKQQRTKDDELALNLLELFKGIPNRTQLKYGTVHNLKKRYGEWKKFKEEFLKQHQPSPTPEVK